MHKRRTVSVLMIVAVLTVTACLGCRKAPTDADAAGDSSFSFAFPYGTDTLDPYVDTRNITRSFCDAMHGFLVWWDNDNAKLNGELASSWRWNSDTEIVFFLRHDFYFNNGRPVTANDVSYTFEKMLDPSWGSVRRAVFEPLIDSVEVLDEYSIVIRLKVTDPIFLTRLVALPILCAESVDTLGDMPVGCGPFEFVSWDPLSLVMRRSPYYPETGLRHASYNRLTVYSFPDEKQLLDAFLNGKVDAAKINASDLTTVAAHTNAYVQGGIGNSYYLAGSQRNEILRTPGVMQAIKYAIDRDDIVNFVLYGFGDSIIAPLTKTSPFYPAGQEYEPDMEKARQYLRDAGYPDGFSITITVSNGTYPQNIARAIQKQLAQINIDVKLDIVDQMTYVERWNVGDVELTVYNTAIANDPAEKYFQWQSGYRTNRVDYDNPEFTRLFIEAGSITDVDRRLALYGRMQEIFLEDAVIQYLVNNHVFYAIHQRASGLLSHYEVFDFTAVTVDGAGGAS